MASLDDIQKAIMESDESAEKILARLLDATNIEMKTEIQNPINLAKLFTYGKWLESCELGSAGKLITDFINVYLLYMVSFDRKRAQEIVHAISERMKMERPMTEKLTNPPK